MDGTQLDGKVVLACGATTGVGRVVVRMFASHGAWVAVLFRSDIAGAKSLVDEIRAEGGRAIMVPGDVLTQEAAWKIARYVEHEWGQVDVLIFASPLAPDEERAADPTPILHEVLPGMNERRWGRVIILRRASEETDIELPDLGPGVLANTLLISDEEQAAQTSEATGWIALALGSGVNSAVTGAVIEVSADGDE
jgi:short chain dehydrogenase